MEYRCAFGKSIDFIIKLVRTPGDRGKWLLVEPLSGLFAVQSSRTAGLVLQFVVLACVVWLDEGFGGRDTGVQCWADLITVRLTWAGFW